jgi:uncharacterized membrane protein YbhN (UPF0104 family)
VLKYGALLLVVVFATVFVVQEWSGFVAGLRRLDAASVAGSVLAILVGLGSAMLSWRAVLTGLGSHLPALAAARVYFLGQLGKYVPGSVWPIVAQAELSKDYGVPRARAGLASLTQMLIGLVVGVCVAGVSLALASPEAFASYWWLVLVALAGVVVLVPPVFNRLVALALRVTHRQPAGAVAGRAILASALWCLGMWLAFGVHLWLLARSIGASGVGLLLLTTGGYALAWVVGFVIVFLPAGAGAREAALILALAPVLAREDALVLAIVSRFLMLAGDGICAGAAILGEKTRTRGGAVSSSGRTGSA